MSITIYGRPECGRCEQTKKQLDRKGLAYNEINVDGNEEARKLVQDSANHLGVKDSILPMVVWRDGRGNAHIWHGFRYDKIKQIHG